MECLKLLVSQKNYVSVCVGGCMRACGYIVKVFALYLSGF